MARRTLLTTMAVLAAASSGACHERFLSSFETAAEAREALAERGWWPGEIPLSATAITEIHDLDTNEQNITFRLPPADCHELQAKAAAAGPSLPAVRSLGLVDWPSWLNGAVTFQAIAGHGAAAVAVREGGLVLLCSESRGYYWR